jgi:hypothetical protein
MLPVPSGLLCLRHVSHLGARECRLDGDFVSESLRISLHRKGSWCPVPSQKPRRDGAPTLLVVLAKSKAWATRRINKVEGAKFLAVIED